MVVSNYDMFDRICRAVVRFEGKRIMYYTEVKNRIGEKIYRITFEDGEEIDYTIDPVLGEIRKISTKETEK